MLSIVHDLRAMLNQILENPNSEYRDVEAGHPRPREWKWYHYAEMVAIAFVFISLFVLFGVVSNQKFTNNNYYVSCSFSFRVVYLLWCLLVGLFVDVKRDFFYIRFCWLH